MLYILPAVEMRENWAAPTQEPDTRRQETDAAGNPEGAQVRKPQDPPVLSSHHPALAPGLGIFPVLCPARERTLAPVASYLQKSRDSAMKLTCFEPTFRNLLYKRLIGQEQP